MTDQPAASDQAREWFIRRGEKEHGPFTSKQLRAMAVSGKIKTDDLLRKGDSSNWIKAGSVKGLFASTNRSGEGVEVQQSPSSEMNGVEATSPKMKVNRKVAFGCAGAFLLFLAMCSGLIRLGSIARERGQQAVQQAERRQDVGPAYARLAGRWRGNDGKLYDLVVQERKENGCWYTDRGTPPSNGQPATAVFNDGGAFVYINGTMRVTGSFRLDGNDRIEITGQGTVTRFENPDVKGGVTDVWVRDTENADDAAIETSEAADSTADISFPTFEAAAGNWKCRKTGKSFHFEQQISRGPDGKPGIARMPWGKHEISPFTVKQGNEIWGFEFHQNGLVYAIPQRNVENERGRIGKFSFDGKTLEIKLALTASRAEVGTLPWEFEYELVRP